MEENLKNNPRVIEVNIENEMKKSFLDYSMSVIVSRALPDVRDGLKPVHRRILYSQFEDNLYPDKPYKKCATTVGNVLGRYHPHGDASVYDALVRLAQDFSMRYMLVDGHGNFGSVDGDPPAAYRYTESKMSKIAVEMLTDIDKETVNFLPNYDDSRKEPEVLPSRYPNLLANGSTGIAVGMATNIPPHNLIEVIDAVCFLMDNPEAELNEITNYIKGPDFPTGGIIMGRAGIRAAYATGRGKITLRARATIEETKNNRFKIVVTELPYQVNKARLIESIANLVKDKRIEGISNIEDHSDRDGMHMEITLKRDASPQIVLNQLYSYSQLQITYGVNMLAIVKGEPKTLTLKEMLTEYIKFQEEIIVRRTKYELKKAQERAHILEGLKIALDYIDEVIEIIKASKDQPSAKRNLSERFGLDEIQAQAIVQMRLGQLSSLEREKIEKELKQLEEKIADYKDILANEWRVKAIIKEEIGKIKDKFGDERKTEILAISGEVDIEDLIPEEDCLLTLTNFGYIKRLKADTYHTQNRGGRGVTGVTTREEDVASEMFVINSHDYVLFFTNKGKVYRQKCYEIPEGSRTSKGMNVANLLPIESDEKVTAMIKLKEFEENKYLILITKLGIIKKVEMNAYNTARKGGLIAIELDEGDELSGVKITNGDDDLIIASKLGKSIRFNEKDVRAVGRQARGSRAIKLKPSDEIVGICVLSEGSKLLTVSETGLGRLSDFDNYRVQTRGGKGTTNYHIDKYGKVASVRVVDLDDDVILISQDGIIIRICVSDIRECARPSKGVRLMRINEGNKVITVARAKQEQEEQKDDNSESEDKKEEI